MANPKGNEASLRNSRFKAAWQSGSTRTIRVPVVLAEAVLEYARQLDNDIQQRDTMNGLSLDGEVPTTQFIDTSGSSNEIQQLNDDELGNLEAENEALRVNYAGLLESSTYITNRLKQELTEVRSRIATPSPEIELPDPLDILNDLRATKRKTKADKSDIEAILEIIEKFWQTHPDRV